MRKQNENRLIDSFSTNPFQGPSPQNLALICKTPETALTIRSKEDLG